MPSQVVQQKLLGLWQRNAEPLYKALELRSRDRAESLQKTLADRAAKEISDITAILSELERAIRDQLDDPDCQQGFLPGLAPIEQEQFERNVDALRRRLQEIPGEIKKETDAIRARFADPRPRMFPVAVTFLVPARLAKGGCRWERRSDFATRRWSDAAGNPPSKCRRPFAIAVTITKASTASRFNPRPRLRLSNSLLGARTRRSASQLSEKFAL